MDLGRSFTYMFEDKDWVAKLAIGGGIILLGVAFFWVLLIPLIAAYALVLGYALVVIRNVYDGSTTPLPEWNNIGDYFVKGITAFVGILIWFIPVIVLSCCIFLVSAVAGGRGDDGRSISGGASLLVTCLSCISIIVGIAISLFMYAPLTNFALNNQISTFWDFAGNWQFIQRNAGNYIIAFLLAYVASIIAGFGIIACLIGVFFTSFWALLVTAHLFGDVARGNMAPTDTTMIPPAPPPMDQPPMEPPMGQGPMEPAPTA
jgi:hypothetical protein